MPFIDIYLDEHGPRIVDSMLNYVGLAFQFILVLFIGYILGYVISVVLKRILNIGELQKAVVRYGAMTTKLWTSITNFLAQYVKWYITVGVLTTLEMGLVDQVFVFITNLLWFILLSIIGLFFGGISYKVIRDALENVGLEAELKKHNIANVFGGVALSSILAGIVKWYIVLLFVGQGVEKLNLPKLTLFVDELMAYIPGAILGLLVILAAMITSNFVSVGIRRHKTPFSALLAAAAEVVILFFGAVLALPKFGVTNVGILEDSFKIMSAGVALGLGISLGLGLKDYIARTCEKYERPKT